MATTYAQALDKIGVSIPAHLVADAEVPIISGLPQAQGDLIIEPVDDPGYAWADLPTSGIQVVVGEATGNTHWLHRGFDSAGVKWARLDTGLSLVAVLVPDGQSAELIHTDEHGANAMGPGCYVIHGKREQADEMRLVAD